MSEHEAFGQFISHLHSHVGKMAVKSKQVALELLRKRLQGGIGEKNANGISVGILLALLRS